MKKRKNKPQEKKSFRMLRIDVKSDDGDDVNLKIPLSLRESLKAVK